MLFSPLWHRHAYRQGSAILILSKGHGFELSVYGRLTDLAVGIELWRILLGENQCNLTRLSLMLR